MMMEPREKKQRCDGGDGASQQVAGSLASVSPSSSPLSPLPLTTTDVHTDTRTDNSGGRHHKRKRKHRKYDDAQNTSDDASSVAAAGLDDWNDINVTASPEPSSSSHSSASMPQYRQPNEQLHPRSRYRDNPPDFLALAAEDEEFRPFVTHVSTPSGSSYGRIDFRGASALLALTRALLRNDYGLLFELPMRNLCPPLTQRLNYLHWVADSVLQLPYNSGGAWKKESTQNAAIASLAPQSTALTSLPQTESNDTPKGPIRALDIGCGASCIFPLLGVREYGWKWLGTEVDAESVKAAQMNVDRNKLQDLIEVRHVGDRSKIFDGVLRDDESFDVCMCNPPFFSDLASTGQNRSRGTVATPSELVCTGGEEEFVKQMIVESKKVPKRVRWCTTMLGRQSSLKSLLQLLRSPAIGASCVIHATLSQGKQSRWALAWTFDEETKKERERKFMNSRQDRNVQVAMGRDSRETQSSNNAPLSTSAASIPAAKQKLSFMLTRPLSSASSNATSIMIDLRSLAEQYAQEHALELQVQEVMPFQWKISMAPKLNEEDGSHTAATSTAAPPSVENSSASSTLTSSFSCDLTLMQSSPGRYMIEMQWRKPQSLEGGTVSVQQQHPQSSKVAFTQFAIAMKQQLTKS